MLNQGPEHTPGAGRPTVCPILIGRATPLAALDRVLGEVVGGQGQTVLIAGDAGIGKSRLITEARGRAQQLGFLVLEGQCFEPDRVLPLAPFLDLLRAHVGRQPANDLARQLGSAAPELIRI